MNFSWLNYLSETVRDTYDYVEVEHCRFVPCIRRADCGLDFSRKGSPSVPFPGLLVADDIYGPGPFGKMPAPASGNPVAVVESGFDAFHVDITEMEKVQIWFDMEVVPFYAMESGTP